jgi:hypothetical protein
MSTIGDLFRQLGSKFDFMGTSTGGPSIVTGAPGAPVSDATITAAALAAYTRSYAQLAPGYGSDGAKSAMLTQALNAAAAAALLPTDDKRVRDLAFAAARSFHPTVIYAGGVDGKTTASSPPAGYVWNAGV